MLGRGGAGAPDHLRHQVVEIARLELRLEGPAFDPAEVEQVADQPAHPLGLGVDRLECFVPVLGSPAHRLVEHAACRGSDRGQRRSQVVGDRVEQGRLEGLAAARDLGVGPFQADAVADDRLAELVCRGRKDARLRAVGLTLVARPQRPDGAKRLSRRLNADPVDGGAVRIAADHGRGHVHADPARRLVARGALQDDLPGRDGQGLSGSRVGDGLLLGRSRPEPEPDAVHGRGGRQPLEHDGRRFLNGPGFGQCPTDAEQRLRLARPLGDLRSALGLDRHEPADGDGHGQEKQQVQPLLGAADGEGIERLDEEKVVGQERGQGRGYGRDCAPAHADGDDRQKVDRGGVGDPQLRHQGYRGRRCDQGAQHRRPNQRGPSQGGSSVVRPRNCHRLDRSPAGPLRTTFEPSLLSGC